MNLLLTAIPPTAQILPPLPEPPPRYETPLRPETAENLWSDYRRAWAGSADIDLYSLHTRAMALLKSRHTPELAALVNCLERDLSPDTTSQP